MKLLELETMSKLFGGVVAVDNLSLEVDEQELVGLIGPNGSGKTTTLNCIAGFYAPSKGEIIFRGENITGLKPHEIASRGLARTFQLATLFPRVTVLQCVMTGLHTKLGTNFWGVVAHTRDGKRKESIARDEALAMLDFVGLTSEKDAVCGSISNYSRRRLALAIALATKPSLLLIDELAAGMSAEETVKIMGMIAKIRQSGVSILLVEHNMRLIMGLCDRIVVLNFGVKIAEGTPAEIASNIDVQQAYLGVAHHA